MPVHTDYYVSLISESGLFSELTFQFQKAKKKDTFSSCLVVLQYGVLDQPSNLFWL